MLRWLSGEQSGNQFVVHVIYVLFGCGDRMCIVFFCLFVCFFCMAARIHVVVKDPCAALVEW